MLTQVSGKPFTATYTHNEFLEVAAGIGVPGLCMFVAWLVILAIDTWKMYFVRKERSMMLGIPVMFLVLLAANMMESYLIFYNYLGGYLFFLLVSLMIIFRDDFKKTSWHIEDIGNLLTKSIITLLLAVQCFTGFYSIYYDYQYAMLDQESPNIVVYETVERYLGNMLNFSLVDGIGKE